MLVVDVSVEVMLVDVKVELLVVDVSVEVVVVTVSVEVVVVEASASLFRFVLFEFIWAVFSVAMTLVENPNDRVME